ncbi:MAG: NADH-quinone oxidoreductase subunit L [Nitrospirota bacterium]
MLNLLVLIPALPLAGFILLALRGRQFPAAANAWIGTGSIGLSALFSIMVAINFVGNPPEGNVFIQTLWTWMQFDGNPVTLSFSLDSLSLIMILVITMVGFLIHLYSTEFMRNEEGYSRFFAFMNLFVGSMLILVLAGDFLLLYIGWEGVGLCSYLLIGFWYRDKDNGKAARKAFIVTRIGDVGMLIGIFLLFLHFETFNIQSVMQAAPKTWQIGSSLAILAAFLFLLGAIGKSAQVPLQVWLPDAMAGPTPVSALIHAATMVTAGVYLIARLHVLFEIAPVIQTMIAIIGAVTLLIAACSAMVQRDIKRVLAYSTISQIGYMFLALGVGAWSAAIFHFMTHAFFKALLFLAAGVVILAQNHEHDMFNMGGLRSLLPLPFVVFVIGAASLSALPLVTAGFYSKDFILLSAWYSPSGSALLWVAGIIGAFLTSIYAFRMVFITFFGVSKIPISHRPGFFMITPLIILAFFSIFGGYIELPETHHFSSFLSPVFGIPGEQPINGEGVLEFGASLVSLSGIFLALLFYVLRPEYAGAFREVPFFASLGTFWFSGWKFDALYDRLLVRPFFLIVRKSKNDFIDAVYTGIAYLNRAIHNNLVRTQTGNLRWYAMGITVGAVVFLGILLVR